MISWARSATKHRVARARSAFVIAHCGLVFRVPPPADQQDERLVFLGDDENEEIYVINSMPLRKRYLPLYEDSKSWRI